MFLTRGENQSTQGKTPQGREEKQQTQPHLEIEPGTDWWEESALTTAPPLLSENLTHVLPGGATLTKAIFKVITRASMDFRS